ncbi:MAG: uroporphyrinogen-III synthase [Eggerthellaceae bacterium]|nr:uroporphyrinogen-III synthase [Eggerthellaceae bacterium]
MVTRPAELVSTMSDRLRALGAEVLDVPAIATVPIENNEKLASVFEEIALYDWIVFTSPSGVRIFFDELLEAGVDCRLVTGEIAALGQGTANELRKHGYFADLVPEGATGEALGEALAAEAEPGSRILIPRARIGNPALVEILANAGHDVDDVPTYDTVPLKDGLIDLAGQFEQGRIFCVAFTSSSGVKAFVEAHPDIDSTFVRAACIGEKTRATAEGFGMQTWMSDKATMESLADLIVERHHVRNRENL